MIEEQGVVTSVLGDYACVRTERKTACGHCDVQGVCGASLLERVFGRRAVELMALNPAGAEVGDRVIVGIAEEGLLRVAAAAYLAPVLSLIAGAWALELAAGEGWSLLGAMLGLALALLWLRRYSVTFARRPGRQPLVVRRLGLASAAVAPPRLEPETE